jgi:serine phosphatase RsbU (regulator of sigma subunit)/Tfp pilus assembly protein PilF
MTKIYTKLYFLFWSLLILPNILFCQNQSEIETLLNQAKESESSGDISQAANLFGKIAFKLWETGQNEQALENFKKAIELNKKLNNQNALQVIYNNIGMIYTDIEQFDKALDYFQKSLEIKKKTGQKNEICSQLINISSALSNLGKYQEANKKLEEALSMALELKDLKLASSCYGSLAENYKKIGNTEKSFEYFNLYSSIDKQVRQKREEDMQKRTESAVAENIVKDRELQSKSEILVKTSDSLKEIGAINQQKQLEINLLNKEKEIDEIKKKEMIALHRNEVQLRNSLMVGLVLVLIIAILIFISLRHKKNVMKRLSLQNEEIQKRNEEIEKRNTEINFQRKLVEDTSQQLEKMLDKVYETNLKMSDSINYAEKIQKAILPNRDKFKEYFSESFIFWKPRDVVSGDFYWFSEIKTSAEDVLIISAVDCTGHGVPGAFMSMIGVSLLKEIAGKLVIDSDKILTELNMEIRKALHQDTTNNKDGMDMSLCVYKKKSQIVEFSGATNSLIYISDNKLYAIKGDKYPIGGFLNSIGHQYTKHLIKIEKPTYFYLYSDGYVDQFGGPDKRKFMTNQFRDLLLKIHLNPMDEQKKILDQTIENWKGKKNNQIDDMLIIGFKIDP